MDDTTHYYKDPPKRIFELLEDTLGDRYTYFLGSPLNIESSAFPCVVVQPVSANNTVKGAPTGTDAVNEMVNIHIMKLDSGNAATTGSTNTVMRDLYNTVQGRDPATGFYMSGTVLYALRTNLNLSGVLIDNDFDVNYDVTQQADRNVVEAVITIVTREHVQVQRVP
jgi:hypothetical protein